VKAPEYTPGPWTWYGNTMPSCPRYHLATMNRGRVTVMDFVRVGLQGVVPRFQVDRRMLPAAELVRYDVDPSVKGLTAAKSADSVYRQDFSDIDHPDARLIVAAPVMADALRALLEVRPVNWDDGEDPEQETAWRAAEAALLAVLGE
jgi:hypothetical protein